MFAMSSMEQQRMEELHATGDAVVQAVITNGGGLGAFGNKSKQAIGDGKGE